MKIDFSQLNKNDIRASREYLLKTLENNIIEDVSNPVILDYMKYANILSFYIMKDRNDKEVTKYWEAIFKACQRSEKNNNYILYKGHLLIKIATNMLISEGNLDKVVKILNESYAEDKIHGYKNPEFRPAYRILSFLQPILMFKNRLWPSDKNIRVQIARRLFIVLGMNKSSSKIAVKKETIIESIRQCISNKKEIIDILRENVDELYAIMEISEKNMTFYKSSMFLMANIIEGVLYDMACGTMKSKKESRINQFLKSWRWRRAQCDTLKTIEKYSINKLAELLRRKGIIGRHVEYYCRFIQHYRDFIHPARDLKHTFKIDINFNKMFLLFMIMLLGDLEKLTPSENKAEGDPIILITD